MGTMAMRPPRSGERPSNRAVPTRAATHGALGSQPLSASHDSYTPGALAAAVAAAGGGPGALSRSTPTMGTAAAGATSAAAAGGAAAAARKPGNAWPSMAGPMPPQDRPSSLGKVSVGRESHGHKDDALSTRSSYSTAHEGPTSSKVSFTHGATAAEGSRQSRHSGNGSGGSSSTNTRPSGGSRAVPAGADAGAAYLGGPSSGPPISAAPLVSPKPPSAPKPKPKPTFNMEASPYFMPRPPPSNINPPGSAGSAGSGPGGAAGASGGPGGNGGAGTSGSAHPKPALKK